MVIFHSYVSLPEGTPRLSLGTAYSNMFQQMIEPRGTRQLKRAGSPSWVIFSAAKLDYNGDQQNYAPREDKEKNGPLRSLSSDIQFLAIPTWIGNQREKENRV
jgi:hypothetical protein